MAMDLKKNPKFDIGRNSGLYFAIGLNIMLFVVLQALETKTYGKEGVSIAAIELSEDFEEEIPITNLEMPPPPPPPPAPEIIQVVDDIEEIEETIIESTETSQDEVIEAPEVKVEEVEDEEVEEDVEVPFSVVEKVPIYPGCKATSNRALSDCFSRKIQEHIKDNFKYPEDLLDLGIKGKVYVLFVVDKKGNISNLRSRGPDKRLEKEAERIISLLPKMIPGKQRNKPVRVPYSIPIHFQIEN